MDLAYDESLNEIWVVTGRELQRYTSNGEQTFVQSLRHLRQVAPDGQGGVWLAGRHKLYRVDASGLIHFEMGPFQGLGLRRLIDIVADHTDHTVWVANKHAIKHIDRDGQILHTFVMEGRGIRRAKIRDLAIYTDAVGPQLTVLSPADASYINSQQPQIAFELVDDGSGVDVESLEILAEGEALPVECSGTLPEWVCTPTVALEDDPVSLSVTVADNAGNRSEPVETTFTIDTQLPEITLQSPVDGLLTNQPVLTVSGSVNEAAMVTLNGEPLTLTIDHTFTETLTLIAGDNSIDLQATDLAGNTTDLSVLVVLDTLSPAAVDLELMHVSDIIDGEVTVTGEPSSVEPESKVTIENQRTGETVTTTANTDGSFILVITAEHSDELSVLVTDQAGNDSDEARTAVTDVVPGVGTIPPDPAQLAPPFSPSAPVTMFASSEFLYNGTPPVQTGVDPSTISKQRIAVVRGLVLDRNNHPLPGVKITIKNHPEFGQTLTRRDGQRRWFADHQL
ncbi:MAG: Ig-like domain-containing protein [Candidatus Thiodiazotropha sp.]